MPRKRVDAQDGIAPSRAALARELGMTPAGVYDWARRFPDAAPTGPPYDVEAWRRFLDANMTRRARRQKAAKAVAEVERAIKTVERSSSRPSPRPGADDTSIGGLLDMRARIRELLEDEAAEESFARLVDLNNRVEDQIRKRESADLKLAQERGELVSRDAAAMVAAEVARVAVAGYERLGATVSSRVEEWLADPAWREMAPGERGVVVRGWVESAIDEIRNAGADEIDAMIERARKETA